MGIILISIGFIFFVISSYEGRKIAAFVLILFVYLTIYYGLSNLKNWVVLLVLIFSYWGIFDAFLEFLEFNEDIAELVINKFLFLIKFFFNCYVVWIFSKPETRNYYKEKGTSII